MLLNHWSRLQSQEFFHYSTLRDQLACTFINTWFLVEFCRLCHGLKKMQCAWASFIKRGEHNDATWTQLHPVSELKLGQYQRWFPQPRILVVKFHLCNRTYLFRVTELVTEAESEPRRGKLPIYRVSLKGMPWVERIEPESAMSGWSAVYWQATLRAALRHQIKKNIHAFL